MKKVLIVCDYFFPSTLVGAVRPSKIAKYLKADNYRVDVFTRYPTDEDASIYCDNFYAFDKRSVVNAAEKTKSSKVNSIKKFASSHFNFFYRRLFKIKSLIAENKKAKKMLSAFKKFAESEKMKYDVVFTTFGPLGSLLCGLYCKKEFSNIKWICDFRDPAVVSQRSFIENIFMRHIEKKACESADKIVSVSNGYVERICRGKYKEKSYMIPNGFDSDDLIYKGENTEPVGCLQFVYAGYLYRNKRDISPLFKAVKELSDEGKIDLSKVKFNYAGTDCDNLIIQASRFGLRDIVVNHGVLPRKECLQLQFSSDLPILSTWNTKKEYGVFPAKLLEYMLIGKPIVTTVAGELPESETAQVVREGNLGFVYEEASAAEDYKGLKDYIFEKYQICVNKERIPYNPCQDVLDRYNYKNIIKRIEAVIED